MTTNALSGTNPAANLSSLSGATRSFANKTDNDGDSDSGGGGIKGGGGTLYNALLAALTQFVTSHSAATAGATSTAPATAPTPASSSTSGAAAGAAPSTLPQDLHAFLHDLFHALRQEGHPRHEVEDSGHSHSAPAPVSISTVPAPVIASGTTPVGTPVAATSTGTTIPGSTTTPLSAPPPSIVQYGQHGIAAELTALIRDLANSGTTTCTPGTASRVSADSLANLNAAFAKLIGDLGGTTAVASTGSGATASPATAATPASTTGSHADTSALQSFLSSFLQDLQGPSASTSGTLGNGVNVTA